jgi:tetratricopeptide (TPR) repeat protein
MHRLLWEGHTRAELATLQEDAQNLAHLEQIEEAEDKFRQVLTGLEYLLSSTHDDTSTVAYELADFYAKNQRMHDADAVLDWLGREHIECWGFRNQKTAAHVLRVMQLYKKWSRSDEVVGLLNRTFGTSETLPLYGDEKSPKTSDQLNKARTPASRGMNGVGERVIDLSRFAYQLTIAKQQVKPSHKKVEPLLLRLISQSENNQEAIPVSQLFDAKCTLAQLYQSHSDLHKLYPALKDAQETFLKALTMEPKHLGMVLKISIHLVNMFLNAELEQEAESMLQLIEKITIDVLDEVESDFVDILVALGKLYQDHDKWNKAELHFQHALAISMRIHGLECRVVRILEAALENRVFDPSSVSRDSLKLEFRRQGFERCGCGGFMGEFGARF